MLCLVAEVHIRKGAAWHKRQDGDGHGDKQAGYPGDAPNDGGRQEGQ